VNNPKPNLDDLRIERGTEPASESRAWPVLVGVVALLGVAAAVWWFLSHRPVAVQTVMAQEIGGSQSDHVVLNASGYVTARRQATVSSKVTGKVTEVLIEEGKRVKEGDVLARIDDTNIKASLLLSEAQLESARKSLEETKVRLREAEQELQRQSDLIKNKIATQADYDHAEASVLAYKAKLQQQQADVIVADRTVATWQQQLDDTVIRAPFSGIVTSKNAQPGEMISPMSAGGSFTRTGICTIVDMESLEIEIDVNESYINRVTSGQPVEATLDAYPDWKIPCKVLAIIPTADRQKSTVKVRVSFDKLDPKILPEMSAKVGFRESAGSSRNGSPTVTLPKTAVQQQDGRDVVLVVQNGRTERRAITVAGSTDANNVLVSAGLAAGERVVVEWPKGLSAGSAVREVESSGERK
jgi:RND family efflux transporter MFP subunit